MGIPYAEVIGDPIAHSKSPIIHKFWLEKLGLDYDFRRTRVPQSELTQFLDQRRADPDWCGCNVTIPNKIAVAEHLDELSGAARVVGAVNCITRSGGEQPHLIGHNTDVTGFLEPLEPWLQREFRYKDASVIGTGGAAAAVSHALAKLGFLVISYGRTAKSAAEFRHKLGLSDDPEFAGEIAGLRIGGSGNWGDRSDVLDLLVNATPLGMDGFPPLPMNLAGWPRNMIVYDAVYAPLETQLLRDARALGFPTIDGLQMLVGQAAIAFELFFAERPPREHDEELRELLTR